MQSFKGLFEGRKQRHLQKSHIWSCLGEISGSFRGAFSCGLHPLSKQSLSLSREAPEDTCGVLQSVLTEEKAPSTLCRRTPPKTSQRSCSESGQRLWSPLGTALPCPAHLAVLHLPCSPSSSCQGNLLQAGAAPLPALLIFLAMTLLLQCIANETNAPLYNIVTIILQRLPLRDSSTSAPKVVPH